MKLTHSNLIDNILNDLTRNKILEEFEKGVQIPTDKKDLQDYFLFMREGEQERLETQN